MRKLRITAALLAVITALIDALLCLDPLSGLDVLLPTAVAALCLAAIVPFDALEPPARKRVVLACLGYIAALACALWFARQRYDQLAPLAMLTLLLLVGMALTGYAFAIRNRRRKPYWAGYYDL